MANITIANKTKRPIWASGAIAFSIDFNTTCRPTTITFCANNKCYCFSFSFCSGLTPTTNLLRSGWAAVVVWEKSGYPWIWLPLWRTNKCAHVLQGQVTQPLFIASQWQSSCLTYTQAVVACRRPHPLHEAGVLRKKTACKTKLGHTSSQLTVPTGP